MCFDSVIQYCVSKTSQNTTLVVTLTFWQHMWIFVYLNLKQAQLSMWLSNQTLKQGAASL